MADKVREQRTEARERRRSLAAKPFEELDESAADGTESTVTPLDAAKGVAATAAAAAIAGALAGAAKAWHDRESSTAGGNGGQEQAPEEPQAEATDEKPAGEEPEAEPNDDDGEEEESQTVPPAAEAEDEQDEAAEEDDEPAQPAAAEQEETSEADEERDGASGGSPGDASRVVAKARDHLKNLFDADAESISGIERANGNWSVTLEVVEMHRIPESTDILSSYTAVLDDDGEIVSLTRGRRYRRSQVEEI